MIGVIHLLVLWIFQLIGVKPADGVVSALSCLVSTCPDLIPLGVNDKVVFFIYKASIFYFLWKKTEIFGYFFAISFKINWKVLCDQSWRSESQCELRSAC